MSGGFFRGTSAAQDTRFSNKQAKLLKTQKFPAELDQLVDTTKVKMDVIKPWIATRVTELLGFEDEVLINFIYGLLDVKEVNGKEIQIQLTGFMEKNTVKFMKELWILLLSAQKNASGVPQQFLDAKEEEIRKKKAETDFLANEIQKKREKENREIEEQRLKKMDDGAEKVANSGLEPTSKNMRSRGTRNHSEDEEGAEKRNGFRGTSSDRHKSRSRSRSPERRQRSFSRGRSSTSPRQRDDRHSFSPRHRSSYSRRRSRSTSLHKSLSPMGGQLHSPSQHGSPPPRKSPYRSSPVEHRPSSPIQHQPLSPTRQRSSSIDEHKRLPSPTGHRRSLSPIRRRHSPSPVRRRRSPKWHRRSPSPGRRRKSPSPRRHRRSPSPGRRRKSPSPRRHRRSPSPGRRRKSPSPRRHRRSPSPGRRRKSPSPRRHRRSPSPRRHHRSPSPRRHHRSPSPRRHHRSPSPRRHHRSPSLPRRHRLPSPHRRKSPSFARRRRSPSPSHRRRSPPPVHYHRSPSLVRCHKSRSPIRQRTPPSSPVWKMDGSSPLDHHRIHSPLKHRSPSTPLSKSPSLSHRSSPARCKSLSPSRHRSISPYDRSSSKERGNLLPVKRKSAQNQRRSLSQSPEVRTRNVKSSPASQQPPISMRSPERDSRRWNSNRAWASSPSLEKSPVLTDSPPVTRSASDDKRLIFPRSQVEQQQQQHRRDNHSTRTGEEEATYAREGGSRKSLSSSIVGKLKDSPEDAKVSSPGSGKHSRREVSAISDQQKSSLSRKEPSLVEEQQRESMKHGQNRHSSSNKPKETEPLTVEKVDHKIRGEASDSDLEEDYKHKTGSKENKRHRRSDRRGTSSDSEGSYETELERKEARKRKKEERRLRKEKKRQRREERRRKKDEHRADKTKAKHLSDDNSDDDDRVAKDEPCPSDGAGEAEHRRLEIELRKKALELFNARKGTRP